MEGKISRNFQKIKLMGLLGNFSTFQYEAGCDEAGRGCLAGPVFAAAVILPSHFDHPLLNDSKKLTASQRHTARSVIEDASLAYAVASVDNKEIDEKNILWASLQAMHLALDKLTVRPEFIIIDGNRFKPYAGVPFKCIVKGDALYLSIAAASILAKTYRDDFMMNAHLQYPDYGWNTNKGYPTPYHASIIHKIGLSPLHRKSFSIPAQISMKFDGS